MNAVVWLHEDGLRLDGCAGRPALFVLDDTLIRARGHGLKRLVFIYETLLELPVVIRRGASVAEVRRFAAEQGADTVLARPTPCPLLRAMLAELEPELPVHPLPEPAFAPVPEPVELRRFSRYWRQVEAMALRPTPPPG